MKMWDEVADPNAKEALRRKSTEEWLRAQLPAPEYGWTPTGLHARTQTLNQEAMKRGEKPPYEAKLKFINELLLVLEGEGLVYCTYRKDRPKRWVQNAFPVRTKTKDDDV